jgi:membrane associated rhomboid family serine protease
MSKQFKRALFVPLIFAGFMVLTFVFEKGMNFDFHYAGIYPRQIKSLGGIFGMLFVHSDWSHLSNNVISFLLLGVCLFYFYHEIALKVFGLSIILCGALLWIIGRENWHIGASGLVYAIAFFLFFSGIIRKHVPLIAISLVITFVYGSMIWHLFPWQANDPISWEGHLSGGITGLVLSIAYRKYGPQKPELDDEDDMENLDEDTEEMDQTNFNSPS